MEPISSCLAPERCGLARALLEVVAAGVAQSERDLLDYSRHTLYHCQTASGDGEAGSSHKSTEALQRALERLSADDMITVSDDDQRWHATHLGQAVFASALAPDEGLQVYRELEKGMFISICTFRQLLFNVY
jgi:DNA polymerase theta